MISTRKRKILSNSQTQTLDSATSSNYCRTLRMLLSAIKTPEGIELPILKRLYCLLVHLSTDHLSRVDANDLRAISDILFNELSVRFYNIFYSLYDASARKDHGESSIHVNCTDDVLFLLLRCSMVVLVLHIHDHNLVLEKGGILLKILCKLCSLNLPMRKDRKSISLQKSVFRACTHDNDDFTTTSREEIAVSLHFCESPDLQTSFAIALLEVFLDELLVHGKLRAIFKLIGLVSSTSEPLFMHQPAQKDINSKKRHSDIGILVELVSTCFLLSFSDEKAIEDFLGRLLRTQRKDFNFYNSPGVSLSGAISLLLNPIMFSAPKIVQAHLVSTVSEAMRSVMDIQKLKPNCGLFNCFLSVFEKSINLYVKHTSFVWTNGLSPSKSAFVNSHTHGGNIPPPFEYYIMPSTHEKINSLIKRLRLEDSSNSILCNHIVELKSDMTSSCIAYAKECQCLLDQSCKSDVFSIISCLIVRASESFDETQKPTTRDMSPQAICLLVAILKLMGTSLLHAVSCLKNEESYGSFKTMKDYLLCKEYMLILGASSCFGKFQMRFPVQQFLCDIMETHSIKHKDFMMMLLHFSGVLAYSFLNRLDYLAKGCLITITALLNLFVLEGFLDELSSLIVSGSDSASSALPLVRVEEALLNQRSIIAVASKFQNIHNLYSSKSKSMVKHCGSVEDVINNEDILSIEEETSNGEMFLKAMQCNAPDMSDLADFIECKQGKDYAGWLKDREKYRKWKFEKVAMLRLKRKKKTWKVFKGRKAF